MAFETILVEQNRNIAIVSLNRPQVKNALNRMMVEELLTALDRLDQDNEMRVIVISGKGSSFCSGRDLGEAREMAKTDLDERRFAYRRMAELMAKISSVSKPIIAAVQGYALAGGCGLAASCDLVVASEDAMFGVPEVKVGLVPGTVTPPLFRSIGRKRATEMLLTGETLDAQEGYRIGLVNKVVPKDKLIESAMEMAQKMVASSPIAIKIWKQAVSAQYDMEDARSLDHFSEIVTIGSFTRDASEGLAAFFEKRKPDWKDH